MSPLTGLLLFLVGMGVGFLLTCGCFARLVAKAMDEQDERDWTGYGPPVTPAQRRTQ